MSKLQVFIGYIIFIIFAEIITSLVDSGLGLATHALILISLLIIYSLNPTENTSKLYLTLTLAPLIRIISLSMPLTNLPQYSWFIVTNIPVLVATLVMMRTLGMGLKTAGLSLKISINQIVIGLTGTSFGFVDYYLLTPEPIATNLSPTNFTILALALAVSTGFTEELLFRGVMQPYAIQAFGERTGLIGIATLFASLHIGWLSIPDIAFVFSIALFYGYVALKTGNIMGITISHGITNIILFMIAPAAILL